MRTESQGRMTNYDDTLADNAESRGDTPYAESGGLIRGMLLSGITVCTCLVVLAGVYEIVRK